MSPFEEIEAATERERAALLETPQIRDALEGRITLARYLAFLSQAWHHVRHTTALLGAATERFPARLAWARPAMAHYVEEETGHDAWILADIRAAGGDAAAVARSRPHPATDAFVAYAWDGVARRNPASIFGMVMVLEGTSVALALRAAERIQSALALPDDAFTYLRSHGRLDQEHVGDLARVLGRLTESADKLAVIASARTLYWLYGQMFRGLDDVSVPLAPARPRLSA